MKKKSAQPLSFPDGELQCFVGTREVGKRAGNKNQNGSYNLSPTKRLSDILLVRRFIRGAAAQKKDEKMTIWTWVYWTGGLHHVFPMVIIDLLDNQHQVCLRPQPTEI